MRAVGLHADVIAVTSRAYATGCVLVRSGAEAFCIDSPVFPDELEILPAIAAQAQFEVVGVLATHADWDHLLGRYAFPEAPLGAAETTAARLVNEPGAAQRELREFDDEFYVQRPSPLSLPGAQQLPVPGHVDIGSPSLGVPPAHGPTADGLAVAGVATRRWAHGRRHGGLDPLGARAGGRRLSVAGRDPDAARQRLGRG